MRTVDFTRPTKFTADQERRIKRALEVFCRTASTRLSAELRMPLELEIINSSQLTWGNAHAQVPAGSVSCLVETPDVDHADAAQRRDEPRDARDRPAAGRRAAAPTAAPRSASGA